MTQTKRKVGTAVDGREKWVLYPFRSLANYKAMHAGLAKQRGVWAELMSARTLTAARRALFG